MALTDWKIAHILTGEYYCPRIAQLTREATQAVVDSVDGIINGDARAYEKLIYGLLLSGLAMQMMGNSRPASGAEHHISHLIEMAPVGIGIHSEALHGEKVGVGTLLTLGEYQRLRRRAPELFRDYRSFSEEEVKEIFDEETAKSILTENEQDCAAEITAQLLQQSWKEICEVLTQLPEFEALYALYRRCGICATLHDIAVPEEKTPQLLDAAPMVRNRLTLMRLRRCL